MGKLTTLMLWMAAALPASASPGTAPIPGQPPSTGESAPAPAATPSRYVGEDTKTYTADLAKLLSISSRTLDPFSQPQDPDAKPIIKSVIAKTPRRTTTAEPQAALSDIVGQIKVTTIMPKDKRFFVNDRSLGIGDKVPLNYRNKTIHTEITEVSSIRIVFRNTETGELGILKLNMLPAGMSRGTKGITAPGMTPADPNAPLQIDSSNSQSVGSITP